MRSWLFLFSCNLMWALQFTCVKLVQDQVGPLFTVWGPMTLATIMLYPLIRRGEKKFPAFRTAPKRHSYVLSSGLAGSLPRPGIDHLRHSHVAGEQRGSADAHPAGFHRRHGGDLSGREDDDVRWISFSLAIAGVLFCSGRDFTV